MVSHSMHELRLTVTPVVTGGGGPVLNSEQPLYTHGAALGSHVFFFWLVDLESDSNFTSHYFNITRPRPSTSSKTNSIMLPLPSRLPKTNNSTSTSSTSSTSTSTSTTPTTTTTTVT